MGGNALKENTAVRLGRADYEKVVIRSLAALREAFPGGQFAEVESYQSKSDFGDADIVCSAPDYNPFVAAKVLGAMEVVRNGPVTSLGVALPSALEGQGGRVDGCSSHEVFQVDLIKQSADTFDFACSYFKANDAGNLAGQIARTLNATLKHEGLYSYYRDGSHKFREILLTRDYAEALGFLGLSASSFNAGFETLGDIFDFIAESPFFDKEVFLQPGPNAKARSRNNKRTTYQAFMQYCRELPANRQPLSLSRSEANLRIQEYFPHFKAEYLQAERDFLRSKELKTRFNGTIVSDITGKYGQELGAQMQAIRNSFESKEAFEDFVVSSDAGNLERVIRAHS